MKKFIFLQILLSFLMVVMPVAAADNNLMIRDFQKKSGITEEDFELLAIGKVYVEDVKKYHEKLAGDDIEKDFSQSIIEDNPHMGQEQTEAWQRYVRNGVKWYRGYLDIKNKITDFLLSYDVPLILNDDEYEMGEAEEYVPTEKPMVVHDFKKIVAYSNKEKDQKAALEKLAKDAEVKSPAKILAEYKKAILTRNWKKIFGFDDDALGFDNEKLKNGSDLRNENLRAIILTKNFGFNDEEFIEWLVVLETDKDAFVLYDDYKEYEGIKVGLSGIENLENVTYGFNMPNEIPVSENDTVIGWGHQFPIYFKGKIVDKNKAVKINVVLTADVCIKNGCKRVRVNPKTELAYSKTVSSSAYGTYIDMISVNIPDEKNKKYFEFGDAVWENNDNQRYVRLEIETEKPELLKIISIGEGRKKLGRALLSIVDGKVVARFKWKDDDFSPVGKTFVFWVQGCENRQYFHAAKIKNLPLSDTQSGRFTLGILGLALMGGFLLNLMPCVFPVLFLKLLAFTKFGGLNLIQIRRNFMFNSIGILSSFAVMAVILAGLKAGGALLGWGMQFQNVYFLGIIIWVVFLFLLMVSGLVRFSDNKISEKILKNRKGACFEFLSGVFLVVLSTPCMAPYLGTAFGVALAGSVGEILITVMTVGFGLAIPYVVIALMPQVAHAMPRPGRWMNTINYLMKLLLALTLVWLIGVLVAQTSNAQIGCWIVYLAIAFVLLFGTDAFKKEVDKQNDRKKVQNLKKFANLFAAFVLAILVVVSLVNAKKDYEKHMQYVKQTTVSEIDMFEIKKNLALGKKVLVKVGADWCLTCKFNDALVFDTKYIEKIVENEKVKVINVDWTDYQEDVLKFMRKFGRVGLPFYVLFSNNYSEGIVLDEMIKEYDLKNILEL